MRKAVVVCGPTAAGKSSLADAFAENLSKIHGEHVPSIVVDSMQVYREIPVTTNQARERPAELVGIVPVSEEWTVARHKESAERSVDSLSPDVPFVLDAGTGMYLNALVLEVTLAPRVSEEIRAEAERLAVSGPNPRREVRRLELELAGEKERGSIWSGRLRYDTTFVYLRPPRPGLDRYIGVRSRRIARGGGVQEAQTLNGSGIEPNPSVGESIGVKELLAYVTGDLPLDEAEEIIARRTRRLARRQMRWFDKLARTLPDTTPFLVVENAADKRIMHCMRDKLVR